MKNFSKAIINNVPTSCGLCEAIDYASVTLTDTWFDYQNTGDYMKYELVIKACIELGVYSGDENFPITDPEFPDDANKAFMKAFDIWDHTTEYGMNRLRVLNKLIDYIELDEVFS